MVATLPVIFYIPTTGALGMLFPLSNKNQQEEIAMSAVTEIPAASSHEAIEHFTRRLSVETDCSDVNTAMNAGDMDFVLLHVVGTQESFARRHVPNAIHLPHKTITPARMNEWSEDTLFVVYCAGPHCNGADQAALKLAKLGRPVKIMIGGLTGWEDEGLPFTTEKN